jgi:hypothetical protein
MFQTFFPDDASFRGNNVNIDKIKGDVLSKYIICEELGRQVSLTMKSN